MKIVTAAIIKKDNRYMVTRRASGEKLAGYWEFPGGKVESGETLEEGLAREIKEELSLTIDVGSLFHEVVHEYDGGAITLKAFNAVWASGELSLSVHDEIRWLLPHEILQLKLAPADIPIAEKLKNVD
jgi:8-oxo-dGTP diphosphatase